MAQLLSGAEELFQAISASLPRTLLTTAMHQDIRRVAALCPDAREYILECRLDGDDPRVDFSLFLEADSALQCLSPGLAQQKPCGFWWHDSWAPIRDLCACWLDPVSNLRQKIEGIWLEFDLDGHFTEQQLPSVFIYPHESGEETLEALIGQSGGLLNVLLPNCASIIQEQVRHYVGHLPPETRIVLGVMLSRTPYHVRLYIPELRPAEVLPYLDRIGRDQVNREMATLLDTFRDLAQTVGLDVNIGPTANEPISQALGLEYITSRMTGGLVALRQLLNHLVTLGLCTPEKHDGLLAWHGQSRVWLRHMFMPSVIERKLSHCKIIVRPWGSLAAKAYLHYDLR